jgi:hypothetical protein
LEEQGQSITLSSIVKGVSAFFSLSLSAEAIPSKEHEQFTTLSSLVKGFFMFLGISMTPA